MRKNLFIVFLAAGLALPAFAQDLTVNISNVRSHRGNLVVAVYRETEADAFPKDPTRAAAVQTVSAETNAPTFLFKDLPAGRYAVALLHDEDGDGKMNFSFVGMPKEGFGFSQNKPVMFGPPPFASAKIEVKDDSSACEVKAKYF